MAFNIAGHLMPITFTSTSIGSRLTGSGVFAENSATTNTALLKLRLITSAELIEQSSTLSINLTSGTLSP
jgi:hypothetical protein